MREVAFIEQNKDKWLEVEAILNKGQTISPDQMADNYIQLLGDLSFAQTYYPRSNTTIYLNFLVTQIYQKIYKTKRIDKNRLKFFFIDYVPMLAYKYRKLIYFSFILFFFFVLIGVLSAQYMPRYIRVILGDDYVNQTLENIEKGDPMGVYSVGSNWGGFIGITLNNIRVAFFSFIGGITAGVMTFFIALQNGVMLGSTGGMLFPKTYSRLLSFKVAFREGVSLLLGTVPFFIVAGFIEGFITRYYNEMPLWLNMLIILGSLSVISFYFLVYPIVKHTKNKYLKP